MSQELFNIAVGVAGTLAGFILRAMWDNIKETQKELSKFKEDVAGDYVTRDRFERISTELFAKIDKINDKVHDRLPRQ